MEDIYKKIDEYNPNKKTKTVDYILWYDCSVIKSLI